MASHFHQTTRTRTPAVPAVSGRHLAHELAGLYRFLAIVHQQVQGLAGCKTVNQVWQLAYMLCLPWRWQVIRSSISNIRWSMINQWTTYSSLIQCKQKHASNKNKFVPSWSGPMLSFGLPVAAMCLWMMNLSTITSQRSNLCTAHTAANRWS